MTSRRNEDDWKQDIVNYLLDYPSGLTITDISNGIDTSRITVSKYIGILEAEKKVITKKIGAYTLYYSAERGLVPKKLMLSYYIGLLTGLKKEIHDKEKFKQFGITIADFMGFPYGSAYPDAVMPNKEGTIEKFFKYFGKTFSYIDFIYEKHPIIKTEIEGNKAKFTLSEIELFDRSENYDVHFYISSGVIEAIVSKTLQRNSYCNVEEIDIKNKSVKLLLEIK